MATITINGITLDPTTQRRQMEAFAVSSLDTTESKYVLIQFEGVVGKIERRRLEECGAELLEYVPHNTYIATYHHDNLKPVNDLAFVSWASSYVRGFKIARSLYDHTDISDLDIAALAVSYDPIGRGDAEVNIVPHKDVGAESIGDEIAVLGALDRGKLDIVDGKIQATVSRDRLSLIADVQGVRHIEPVDRR